MNLEQTKIKNVVGIGGKIITIAAFAVATVSVCLPIVAYTKKFPLNLIWPDFVAIALMVVAGYLFREHQKEKDIIKLYACHLLLCMAMVSSNIVWAGIPFVDILMFLSASIFGMASIVFLIMLLSAYLWKKMKISS